MEARRQGPVGGERVTPCVGCGKSALLLRDDDRETITVGGAPGVVCDECAEKRRRQRAQDAERARKYRARKRLIKLAWGVEPEPGTVTHHGARNARAVLSNRNRNKRFHDRLRKIGGRKSNASESSPGEEKPTHCECGRALNLGRYKTTGDTCGTCKKAEKQKERDRLPWYVRSEEELEQQLNDWTPLEDDDG